MGTAPSEEQPPYPPARAAKPRKISGLAFRIRGSVQPGVSVDVRMRCPCTRCDLDAAEVEARRSSTLRTSGGETQVITETAPKGARLNARQAAGAALFLAASHGQL